MPKQTKEEFNEQQRLRWLFDEEYREKRLLQGRESRKRNREKDAERARIKRQEKRKFLVEHLGGKCVGCGITENLQFDHIDRKQKLFTISKKIHSYSIERLLPEVEKCQLLCFKCHEFKSLINHDKNKLAEGYKVSKIDKLGDKIIVTLEPHISISNETQ
jgi:hypothetical protein